MQEMFVKNLTTISREKSKDKMNVNYKDLAEVVNSDDILQFLQGTCKKNCKTLEADVIPVYKFQDYGPNYQSCIKVSLSSAQNIVIIIKMFWGFQTLLTEINGNSTTISRHFTNAY